MSDQFPLVKPIARKLAILVVAPFVVIITLLLLLSQGIHNYPLAISNADQGFDMPMAGHISIPANLVKAIDRQAFDVHESATAAEAQALFDSGAVKALLVFPAELTEDMMIKLDDPSYVLPAKISLRVNEANPLARLMVMATIGRSSLAALQESGGGPSLDSLPVPLDLGSLIEGLQAAPTYLVAALLAFLSFVLTGILAYRAALGLRDHRPMLARSSFLHTAAFSLVFSLAGLALYLLLVTTSFAILGLPLSPSLYLAAPVVWLLLLVAPALAFALTMAAKEVEKTRPLIPFLILPLFFGGFLFPAELLPVWLQWIKFIFPAYYGINGALAVQTQTGDAFAPWQIAITALWALAFLALGVLALKRHARVNIGEAADRA